jgi:hypothetical protein
MGRRVISLTDAPIRTPVLIRPLLVHLALPMEPILFLLLPSRTMFVGRSTMLLWKKSMKRGRDQHAVTVAEWASGLVGHGPTPICDGPALCRWAGAI